MIQNPQLTESMQSGKLFIPQSPATNLKTKEISRWQQRRNTNTNQMNLLSNIESYFQSKPDSKQSSSSPTNNNNNMAKTNSNDGAKKRFLRKGCGTVNQRNKYEMERQKQAERKRQRQLGIIQTKPKTQKIILMEQWREKIKQKDKLLRKKKEQMAAIQASQNDEENMMNINISNDKQNKNKLNQQNFIRPTKSFEANINSSLTSKKAVTNLNAMKLLKQKQKRTKIQRSNTAPPIQINIDADFTTEQKTPSDELESASKFEDMHQFEDAVLIKQHSDDNNHEIEEKSCTQNMTQSHQQDNNQDVGIWTMPKLPKKIMVKPSKGYNFARHSVNDRNKTAHFPAYSHHHHTALYGQKWGKANKMKNNASQDNNNVNIPNANKNKYYSESKNLFHKQATINSMSKRDRLAAKYLDRKANEPQINAEKQYLLKTQELQQMISKYEEKCHDAEMMKNSSLEAFRKYQSLINEKVGSLEQRQKDFEKYKKKQERILMQKTSELDKRSRALLNIPDRKQRTQIEELKKEINDLKLEFQTKEKRFKSKVERLKKQNKKINQDKIELQNELKKIQKQQLENGNNRNQQHCSNTMPIVMSARNKKPLTPNAMMMRQKKKKYSISKIDVNTNRPKSQHSMRKPTMQYMTATPNATTMVNRSTNNLYEAYQHQHQHQYMNNVQVISPFDNNQRYHNYMNNMNEEEYDSDSSESSSTSDESTKNGEDEEHKNNAVLVTNQNTQNLKRNNMKHSKQELKQEVEESENEVVMNHLPAVPEEFDPDKMSEEQYNCDSVTHRDSPIERMQHPDGKIEQVYGDGSKLILFTNGTEKYIFSNLSGKYKQIYVKFPNGDIKKILEDGSEVYFYSKNNIIHATKVDGIELFYFSGQHEVHFPDETKHILFADGTKKYIYPNGDEQCVFPNKE